MRILKLLLPIPDLYICSLCLCLLLTPLAGLAKTDDEQLVIGIISTKAQKHIKNTQPLADYLAENLKEFGITSAKVRINNNLDKMGSWLQSGEVDIVTESIFPALSLKEKYNADITLLRWKKSVNVYSSLFFTHKDSGIKNFDDLVGKKIAFENKFSTSAFYIPAAMLITSGYKLQKLNSLNEPVDEDKIGYVFTEELLTISNEVSISSWVYRKQVAAGAFSDVDWRDPEVMPVPYKNQLVIFEKSPPVPRSVMLYSPNMDPLLKQSINKILINAHKDQKGRDALYAFNNTRKFQIFQHDENQLKKIKKLQKVVISNLM